MSKSELIEKFKEIYGVNTLEYIGLLEVRNVKYNKRRGLYAVRFKDLYANKNRIIYFSERVYYILPKKGENYHFTKDGYHEDIFGDMVIHYSIDNLADKHLNIYCNTEGSQIIL